MDIALRNNQIELNYKCESQILKQILDLCKIKHYIIENEDVILPYENRKFTHNGCRVYFEDINKPFKRSFSFWINSPTTYKNKIIKLNYKPSINKVYKLLLLLDSYNYLATQYNYIPQNEIIEG